MKKPMTLHRRLFLGAMLLGFILSTLCALAAVWVAEDYEHVVAHEILRGQAEDYSLRLANRLPATLPQTQRLNGYLASASHLPRAFAALPPGMHELDGREGLNIGVFDTSAGRLIFTIDLSDIEVLEQHLNLVLAGMIIFGTLVAGGLGGLLAKAAITPVRRLAEQVDALSTMPAPTNLAIGVSDDELGRLAVAIDAYQARLVDADAREQAFFADASHELRTPLAVVQGVTEVLLDDPPTSPMALARLQRLERGVRDMRQLLEAMLGAARRKPLHFESVQLADLLEEATALAASGSQPIQTVIDTEAVLMLPRQEAVLLISGLSRKLIHSQAATGLRFKFDHPWLVIESIGGQNESDLQRVNSMRADLGTGSALLDRLATRLGWQICFDVPGRIDISLPNAPSDSASNG